MQICRQPEFSMHSFLSLSPGLESTQEGCFLHIITICDCDCDCEIAYLKWEVQNYQSVIFIDSNYYLNIKYIWMATYIM